MKKIVIIGFLVFSIISCKKKNDEPKPNISYNSDMKELSGTTWLFVDEGDKDGTWVNSTFVDDRLNHATLSYIDSTIIFKINGSSTTWTMTYYLDNNNWLYYYYNPKNSNSTFQPFGLQYSINNNVMIQTNSIGQWSKYIKQ